MKAVKLSGSARTSVGKALAAKNRAEGMVPGVIYGGEKQVSILVKENDLNKVVFTPHVYQFVLDIDGSEYKAVLKDIQQHPVTDRVIHFDFLEIVPGKELKLRLPIKLKGVPIGVRNGGVLVTPTRKVIVKGIPDEFPDIIEVDVENLKIGQSIKVGDLVKPNLQILADDNSLVAAVKMSRGAIVDTGEEGEEGEEGAAPAEGGDAAPAEGGDAKPAE